MRAFHANITYLASEIATKAIKSVQTKQQGVAASQNAVETKELSPRSAGEWFGIPKTTVYWHVAKKYAKLGVGRPAVGAVLGEGGQKSIVQSCQCMGVSNCWNGIWNGW